MNVCLSEKKEYSRKDVANIIGNVLFDALNNKPNSYYKMLHMQRAAWQIDWIEKNIACT